VRIVFKSPENSTRRSPIAHAFIVVTSGSAASKAGGVQRGRRVYVQYTRMHLTRSICTTPNHGPRSRQGSYNFVIERTSMSSSCAPGGVVSTTRGERLHAFRSGLGSFPQVTAREVSYSNPLRATSGLRQRSMLLPSQTRQAGSRYVFQSYETSARLTQARRSTCATGTPPCARTRAPRSSLVGKGSCPGAASAGSESGRFQATLQGVH